MGDTEKALADYEEALKKDSRCFSALNNRGNLRREKGDRDGAIEDYTAALQIDPDYYEGYRNRGLTLEDKGDKEGAKADYAKALECAPPDWHLRTNTEGLLRALGGTPR